MKTTTTCTVPKNNPLIREKNRRYMMKLISRIVTAVMTVCLDVLKDSPKSEILISHDSMYRLFGNNNAHKGLLGITSYIFKNKVKLNICGHHHASEVKHKFGCTVVCVYRCSLITYPDISVLNIF